MKALLTACLLLAGCASPCSDELTPEQLSYGATMTECDHRSWNRETALEEARERQYEKRMTEQCGAWCEMRLWAVGLLLLKG